LGGIPEGSETENIILCCDDKKYFQLTLQQRYQIEALKDAGHNQTFMQI